MKLEKIFVLFMALTLGVFLSSGAVVWIVADARAENVPAAEEEDEDDEDGEEDDFCADFGPEKIDVSKYPTEQQKNYKVFASRCSKCHTLARPINTEAHATLDDWEKYVNKMKKKRRSGIRKKDVPLIISFLAYDTKTRKKDILARRLKEIEAGQIEHSEVIEHNTTDCKWKKKGG